MQALDWQTKKNKRLALWLVLLLVITVATAFLLGGESRVDIDKSLFKVQNTQEVDRIVMERRNQKTEVAYNGSRWKVNDIYDADPQLVKVVMATLQQLEPKRKISEPGDSVHKALDSAGVKVTVFANNQEVNTFVAGGNFQKTQALFKKPASDDIFVAHIPGYRVYVAGIFELNALQWRQKRVFNFNWRNFAELEATFPDNPSANFKVAPRDGMFGVEGVKTDTTKLSGFMDAVLALSVTEYVEAPAMVDSLRSTKPVMAILIKDVAQKEYRLDLFREKPDGSAPVLINGAELAIINGQYIRSIIRPRAYFSMR
jgi:hypothetical protein